MLVKDPYSATWISHSSVSDYLKCPRLYFLRNVYRDPVTKHKVTLMSPPLALGQAVHDVIESLSQLPAERRFTDPLLELFDKQWEAVAGDKGGFRDTHEEKRYKERGKAMIQRIVNHPGPLLGKAVKIRQELPHFWLSEEDNLILCGKIDWLEYKESDDSVHILDFKTGKNDEEGGSLQLPMYTLLVANCQKRKISGASYWYIDRDDEPVSVDLPDVTEAKKNIVEIGKQIALARKLNHFVCKKSGCRFCAPMEKILQGVCKLVGQSIYKQDIYIEPS